MVPEDWKTDNVAPLFNEGVRQKTGKYRTVSIIAIIGMMRKSIMIEEIANHLRKLYIIKPIQVNYV